MTRLSEIIRSYMIIHGRASAYDIYNHINRKYEYLSIVRYFHLLKKLGLIEEIGKIKTSKNGPLKKTLYRIKPGKEDDECWVKPWRCYGIKYNKPYYIPKTDLILDRRGRIRSDTIIRRYCKLVNEVGQDEVPLVTLASSLKITPKELLSILEILNIEYNIVTTVDGYKLIYIPDRRNIC